MAQQNQKTPAKARRKIRYATGGDEAPDGALRPFISMERQEREIPWGESSNNPLSSHFVPLQTRTERDKSRWWALHAKRGGHPSQGVLDE